MYVCVHVATLGHAHGHKGGPCERKSNLDLIRKFCDSTFGLVTTESSTSKVNSTQPSWRKQNFRRRCR